MSAALRFLWCARFAGLLGLLLVGSSAAAADPAEFAGHPVVQVSLIAVRGELPSENLEPLLRVRQGQALDLGLVRQDLALLHQAGGFDAVEAVAEPWTIDTAEGPADGVIISYRVVSAPRVDLIEVDGPRFGKARRVIDAAVGIHKEDAFYAESELSMLEARVVSALAADGWSHARATASAAPVGEGRVAVQLQVDPGEASTYGHLNIVGDIIPDEDRACGFVGEALLRPGCGLPARKVKRWLRRHGVAEGRRVVPQDFDEALVDLRRRLVAEGWLQTRISYRALRADAGELAEIRTITVEAGPRLQVAVAAQTRRERLLPPADALLETMGFFGGERVDEAALREARDRMRGWYDRQGYPEAAVELSSTPTKDGTRLELQVTHGGRQHVRSFQIRGAKAMTDAEVTGALRAAAPDTLGERRNSAAGVAEALIGVEEVYRGQGFLSAKLTHFETAKLRRRLPWLLPRLRRVPVAVVIRVSEGPQTLLGGMRSVGGNGLEDELIAASSAQMLSGPYSPTALDALSNQIKALYQGQGYLDVVVALEVGLSEDKQLANAVFVVRPGHQVLLRSVVVRGNRRTRPKVVSREVRVGVGEPLTPAALAESRQAIYALDLFRVVAPELVGEDPGVRDLLISVDEKPNIQFDLGGRISTDQGVLAQARATHRNLSGLGQKVSLLGQVGYGWFGEEWRVDTLQPVYRAAVRYTVPYVPAAGGNLFVEALLREAVQEPTFGIRRSGVVFGLNQQITRPLLMVFDYGVDFRVLEDVDPGALVPGDPWLDVLGVNTAGLGEVILPSAPRVQTGPSLLVVWDKRNDPFNATEGHLLSGQVEGALQSGAAGAMVRGELRAEKVIPAGPLILDLVGRAGAGMVRGARSTLALEDRFYLGGGGSMRGFRLNSVGPANFAARPRLDLPGALGPLVEGSAIRDAPAQWVNTGGDSMLKGTFELRVPLSVLPSVKSDSASFVTFAEVGRVAFLDPYAVTTSSAEGSDPWARFSTGVGLRVATPIGPAAIELGINPFRIEERGESLLLPHLSIGGL